MELSNLLRYTTRLPKNLKEGLIEITPVEIVGLNYVMTKNKSNKFAADIIGRVDLDDGNQSKYNRNVHETYTRKKLRHNRNRHETNNVTG